MSARHALAVIQRLLSVVVLVMSGGYLLIYLYRWEWNRAIVAGIFFVAAEVGLATSMILHRLRALEATTAGAAATAPTAVRDRLRRTPVDRPNPFQWLSPRDGRLSVFVPVLLGAGVVLSAVAYVVERVAEATALPAVDRDLARRLAAIAPPAGGLRGDRPASGPAGPRQRGMTLGAVVAVASVAVLVWLAVSAAMDMTQSRPDPADLPRRTTIELAIVERGDQGPTEATAEALWVGCRWTLGEQGERTARIVPRDGDHALLVLEPGLGPLRVRRLAGCLSDLTLDRIRADVLRVTSEG